ncbi:MAG: 3-oxoadipate enol-lactonase [Frankiaceae bacterium]|jgi:pimeloyl-ACP methyl ester carboxylesterase|nr:3-oxoadipate enol-lactonase [Frankiaceae bacterium]MDX6224558.1 3-oxoadipate enol-lactonase [Frankiales bacterium]
MRALIHDVELDYELSGSGPELVWLHGLSGSVDESRWLTDHLATRFRVLTYSTRGHGRSSPVLERHRYRYDVIADDLDAMLDHVGFSKPIVAGGSHGANTALRHAVRHPGRVSGLVLVAPGSNALRRPDRLRWGLVRGQLALARRHGADGIVRAITGQDPGDPAADQAAIAAARSHDLASLEAAMRHIADQRVVPPEALRGVQVPTVVAAWRKDPVLHPFGVAQRIAQLIPDAELHELPRPGQVPQAEAAELVAVLVDRVLARLRQ